MGGGFAGRRASPSVNLAVRAFARLRRGGLRYPSADLWPSPSKSNRTAAPPSVARSTRWPHRSSTPAPRVTSRAGRTACARTAAATRAKRSSRRACTTTITTTRPRAVGPSGRIAARPTSLSRRMPARRSNASDLTDGSRLGTAARALGPDHRGRRQRRRPGSRGGRRRRDRGRPPGGPRAAVRAGRRDGQRRCRRRGHRRPAVDRQGAQPGRRRARAPAVLDRARHAGRRRGRGRRARVGGRHRRGAGGRAVQHQARPRDPAPRARGAASRARACR